MLRARLFLLLLLLSPFAVIAQDTTEVPAGVVSVKRAPVQAAFLVNVQYAYPEAAANRSHISKFNRKEIVLSDSGNAVLPPVPIDSRTIKTDGSITHYLKKNYPASYNWTTMFSDMNYSFAWSDSTRHDSARVEVFVDRDGKATYRPLPWKTQDSATTALQTEMLKKLYVTTMHWYPARLQRKRKMKRTSSYAIITVYAYDPNEGRSLPIEVLPK